LLLLIEPTGFGAGGRLTNGAWSYDDFAPWTHAASAGNGFILLYNTISGLAAWGRAYA